MTTETYYVPNISCDHCVLTIERELPQELERILTVTADQETKRVTVSYEAPASAEAIAAVMEELGYPIAKTIAS